MEEGKFGLREKIEETRKAVTSLSKKLEREKVRHLKTKDEIGRRRLAGSLTELELKDRMPEKFFGLTIGISKAKTIKEKFDLLLEAIESVDNIPTPEGEKQKTKDKIKKEIEEVRDVLMKTPVPPGSTKEREKEIYSYIKSKLDPEGITSAYHIDRYVADIWAKAVEEAEKQEKEENRS